MNIPNLSQPRPVLPEHSAFSVAKPLADLLANYAPEVRNLALAARSFVLAMIPDITERVDMKARIIGYGYGPKRSGTVGMIMPTKAGVNLGVGYAMFLPDPHKLLEDTGKRRGRPSGNRVWRVEPFVPSDWPHLTTYH